MLFSFQEEVGETAERRRGERVALCFDVLR